MHEWSDDGVRVGQWMNVWQFGGKDQVAWQSVSGAKLIAPC
jgi:hypothetical protein